MKPWLIGFTGQAGAGKSTAAKFLMEHGYTITSFASPIKRVAKSMGWNGQKDDKGRRLLQHLGTECGRNCIGEDCWIDLWQKDNEREIFTRNLLVVDDVRFNNEAILIKRLGGIVVKISRKEADVFHWFWQKKFWQKKHASEGGVHPRLIDESINNEFCEEELKCSLQFLLEDEI